MIRLAISIFLGVVLLFSCEKETDITPKTDLVQLTEQLTTPSEFTAFIQAFQAYKAEVAVGLLKVTEELSSGEFSISATDPIVWSHLNEYETYKRAEIKLVEAVANYRSVFAEVSASYGRENAISALESLAIEEANKEDLSYQEAIQTYPTYFGEGLPRRWECFQGYINDMNTCDSGSMVVLITTICAYHDPNGEATPYCYTMGLLQCRDEALSRYDTCQENP